MSSSTVLPQVQSCADELVSVLQAGLQSTKIKHFVIRKRNVSEQINVKLSDKFCFGGDKELYEMVVSMHNTKHAMDLSNGVVYECSYCDNNHCWRCCAIKMIFRTDSLKDLCKIMQNITSYIVLCHLCGECTQTVPALLSPPAIGDLIQGKPIHCFAKLSDHKHLCHECISGCLFARQDFFECQICCMTKAASQLHTFQGQCVKHSDKICKQCIRMSHKCPICREDSGDQSSEDGDSD